MRERRDRAGFAVRVPLAGLTGVPPAPHIAPRGVEPPDADRWEARFRYPDGSLGTVPAVLDLAPGRALGRLCLRADAAGNLAVELTRRPLADTVAWAADGTLTVAGTWGADDVRDAAARLVLRHTVLREEVAVPVARDGVRFRATVPPETTASLVEGRWSTLLGDFPVRLLTSAGAALPANTASPDAGSPRPAATATGWSSSPGRPSPRPSAGRTGSAGCGRRTTRTGAATAR